MIFKNRKRIIQHQYTIIELLVVLVITGLLTGISIGGIKGALARQGAAGGVRTLSAKISLAQSFAVSRNRYVALLMPDDDGFNGGLNGSTESNNPIPTNNTDNFDNEFLFTQNRLCYVTRGLDGSGDTVYTFDRWVKGYEWQRLPSKTIAFIVYEIASNDNPIQDSNSAQVIDIESTDRNSSAIIFKPSGALINANSVIVRVYRAAYLPLDSASNFYWQNKETAERGWKIGINGFTGRTRFCLGGENVAE